MSHRLSPINRSESPGSMPDLGSDGEESPRSLGSDSSFNDASSILDRSETPPIQREPPEAYFEDFTLPSGDRPQWTVADIRTKQLRMDDLSSYMTELHQNLSPETAHRTLRIAEAVEKKAIARQNQEIKSEGRLARLPFVGGLFRSSALEPVDNIRHQASELKVAAQKVLDLRGESKYGGMRMDLPKGIEVAVGIRGLTPDYQKLIEGIPTTENTGLKGFDLVTARYKYSHQIAQKVDQLRLQLNQLKPQGASQQSGIEALKDQQRVLAAFVQSARQNAGYDS